MEHGTRWRWAAVMLVAATAALMLALPAQAHNPSRGITLKAGTSSSVRSTTFTHATFTIQFVAYFGSVRRTRAYLDHVTFKTCPEISITGWIMYAYNSGHTYYYQADAGRTYFSCGSFTQQVDKTFYGGYAGGNVAVYVEKRNTDPYCTPSACETHKSTVVFYVPPT
jgi:hypothetical protein